MKNKIIINLGLASILTTGAFGFSIDDRDQFSQPNKNHI